MLTGLLSSAAALSPGLRAAQAGLAAALGLAVGSFLSVCIHRLPRGESVISPPSHCPGCGHRLGPAELVPLLSYLLQRGRCRHCGAGISWMYPAVEALTAALFFGLVWVGGGWVPALPGLAASALAVAAAGTDLRSRLIPNRLVLAGLALAVPVLGAARPPAAWPWHLAGLGAAGGVLALAALLSRGGMGAGDVKLGGVLGLYLGWPMALVALFWGFLAGALVGVVLLALRLKGRRDVIPFAPFLAVGTAAALFFGARFVGFVWPWG
ncbi:MAG: prepilin peptidase [Acetobacteraceae bacterium]|nr:prepilin peptidase [Acetobacteraceae bacterium]